MVKVIVTKQANTVTIFDEGHKQLCIAISLNKGKYKITVNKDDNAETRILEG